MNHYPPDRPAKFATTQWSIVLRAGGPTSDEARNSLGELVQTYWYPLYAFSRRRGYSDHDSMDLTQGFFAHLLQCHALDSVSPYKGRFRSFLLASFENYMATEWRAASALRRGGAVTKVSLSDFGTRYDHEPVHEESADRLFERSWVESILERVRLRLADDYQRAQKKELFDLLEPHLSNRNDALPRAEISRRLNLSIAAVAMSLHRMRRRYAELLREEIATTVGDSADVDDELRDLMAIVSRTS
jgi:RNA polymerase sigma-70 factor (ECF subfamily)